MKKDKLIPKRRFKEFQNYGAWEQRKLGEVGYFYYGKSAPKWSVTEDATTPCVRYGELYSKYNEKIDNVHSCTNIPKDNLKFSTGKEVLIPRVGEDPLDFANCAWLSVPNVAIGEMISVYNTDQNPLFTAYMFNGKLKYEFAKRVEGGNVSNLYYTYLEDIMVSYPCIEEQKKIVGFFSNLDNLIILHQRKLGKLKNIKSAYLSEMFPKEGEKYPKQRFAGFTDPWELRKLGEVTNIKSGSSDLKDADVDGKYPLFVRSENVKRSNRYIFEGEAILIPGEGRLGEIYHYINGKFDYHQRVYKISHFDEETIKGKFTLYYLQQNFKHHALKFTVKATVDSLRLPMLTDFEIKLPKIEEQEKIGTFFNQLDNLITLHQHKLEKLENLKKAYLNEMFV